MNKVKQIGYSYIRSDISVETVQLTMDDKRKTFWVYNYQGISYRLFKSKKELNKFLKGQSSTHFSFDSEKELDTHFKFTPI
ncbi:hypothetical protein [Gracilimonas tropica]|uniref:hypothetical protein n=1 Tax=Gracilimonas tropica TaxID=454600 RepID=UPI000361F5EE|nr:hypothetical protein [Gracilimonas tropica]